MNKTSTINKQAIERTRNDASRCIHLRCEPFINIGQQEVDSAIQIPGVGPGMKQQIRFIAGTPQLQLVCISPAQIDRVKNTMLSSIPDVASQLVKFETSLDICMCCSFFNSLVEETI